MKSVYLVGLSVILPLSAGCATRSDHVDRNDPTNTSLSLEEVIEKAGEFAELPAAHGPIPVGDPGETTLHYNDGKTKSLWSCRTQRVSMQKNPERFTTLNPNADIIYPGALVQGGWLDSGSPESIPVARGGGTIVLALVNGAEAKFQRKLDEITQGNVVDAQNELLAVARRGT
ncbi:MAG TPA: hypothetical protein VM580_00520 [Labilithrix sp.]|jgi:hypothetical protein|nr:hypothetical protein [Labilithrix sp.]